jgi:hypothetical protein
VRPLARPKMEFVGRFVTTLRHGQQPPKRPRLRLGTGSYRYGSARVLDKLGTTKISFAPHELTSSKGAIAVFGDHELA